MIILAVYLLAPTGLVASIRRTDAFPTVAACEAAIIADMPDLDRLTADLTARLGMPIIAVPRCLAAVQGVAA
jgi:hypothetical protein